MSRPAVAAAHLTIRSVFSVDLRRVPQTTGVALRATQHPTVRSDPFSLLPAVRNFFTSGSRPYVWSDPVESVGGPLKSRNCRLRLSETVFRGLETLCRPVFTADLDAD